MDEPTAGAGFKLERTEERAREAYDPRPIYITLRFRADLDSAADNEHIQRQLVRTFGHWEDGRRPFEVEHLLDALEHMLEAAAYLRPREERDWRCPRCGAVWAERGVPCSHIEERDDGKWWITEEQPAVCKPCTQKAREQLEAEKARLEEEQTVICVQGTGMDGVDGPRWDELDERIDEIRDLLMIHGERIWVKAEPASELRKCRPKRPKLRMGEVKVSEDEALTESSMAAVTVEDAPEHEFPR